MSFLKKHSLWLLVIVYTGWIFQNSLASGSASGSFSGAITAFLLQLLPVDISFDAFHFLIRKGAHFSEFCLLGILVRFAFQKQPLSISEKRLLIFFAAVPFLDESLQHFVPGRYGSFKDILLDLCGYCFGLFVFRVFSRITSREHS